MGPDIEIRAAKINSGARINKHLRDEPYREIGFSDNGTGLDDKYRDLVFELFQRIGNSPDSGAGLGCPL